MYTSPLVELRKGSDGSPTLRDVARRMKVSPAAVSLFEIGRYKPSKDFASGYAKAIDRPLREVWVRWRKIALKYHVTAARALRREIQAARVGLVADRRRRPA